MPIINGVGISENTPAKQYSFRNIIATHMKICKRIYKKNNQWVYNNNYLYVDLNAGWGKHNGFTGSPIIFLEEATRIFTEVNIGCYLCEIKKETYDILLGNLNDFCCEPLNAAVITTETKGNLLCGGKLVVVNQDNCQWIENVNLSDNISNNTSQKTFGIIYSDPNNHEANFSGLAHLSCQKQLSTTDILIHVSPTIIKRVAGIKDSMRMINDEINRINKKYWLIREPFGPQQWTFLLGTNWNCFPDFKELGFANLASKRGQEFLEKVSHTNKELRELQKKTIPPTKNIYDTQNLGLFGALL